MALKGLYREVWEDEELRKNKLVRIKKKKQLRSD